MAGFQPSKLAVAGSNPVVRSKNALLLAPQAVPALASGDGWSLTVVLRGRPPGEGKRAVCTSPGSTPGGRAFRFWPGITWSRAGKLSLVERWTLNPVDGSSNLSRRTETRT